MNETTILVIDDSATIRRLVDTSLSPAGYRVVLAENAERGLELAAEIKPDLILLDHQLPGTTGAEVCASLLEHSELAQIPVVISSTLRKKAYVEYTELDNVVDMLPKPYTAELLATTVENALHTASMVVESQSQGTAVPEVIQQLGDPDLQGSFKSFGLRELIDFLNNADKSGVLELELEQQRVHIFLSRGRIVGLTASGITANDLAAQMPESLRSLTPVLGMTLGGHSTNEFGNLFELLNHQVIDPRLLKRLLRYQAAALILHCFENELREFRFFSGQNSPPLQSKLPLDISLLALLIEGAQARPNPTVTEDVHQVFQRRAARGQNLDRAGVSARHLKLLATLSEPRSEEELASQLGWPAEEVRQVLMGFLMAGLVQSQERGQVRQVVLFESDAAVAQQMRRSFEDAGSNYQGKVVRDRLALQLVLKRVVPDVMVFNLADQEAQHLAGEIARLARQPESWAHNVRCIGIVADNQATDGLGLDAVIRAPYEPGDVLTAVDSVMQTASQLTPAQSGSTGSSVGLEISTAG